MCICVSACVCVYISVSRRDLDSLISPEVYGTAAGHSIVCEGAVDGGGSVREVQPLQVARRTVVVIAVHVDNVVCKEREERERQIERTRERERERRRGKTERENGEE